MSITLEQAGSPWRKRTGEDLTVGIREIKRPRYYHFRLESESSKASDDETESVWSVQGKDTDVVWDTSDTESKASEVNGDEYELEFEYEVASLSEGDDVEISTTDSEGMILAAAAAVMCNSSIEAWVTVTDVEDSGTSSDETSFGRTDFSTCVQCKGKNCNPLYRYCEKCFQDRKKFYPPRPRRNKRKREKKPCKEDPVKLDTLRHFLTGLSQDSGIGSSQECPSLGLDQIVVPDHLQDSGSSQSQDIAVTPPKSEGTKSDSKPKQGSSRSQEVVVTLPASSVSEEIESDSKLKELNLRRKRQSSESSLSDFEVKKPKLSVKPEHQTSDLGSEVSSTSSLASTVASLTSETSGFCSEKSSGSISLEKSKSFGSDKSETDLCMFCNSAPKDSVFLHTNMAHRCCCYPCAKKTLKSVKRCPICNRTVTKVVKIFTA